MTVIKAPTQEQRIQAQCCLFDMDGLLLNTEDIYTEASVMILARYGLGDSYHWGIKTKLMGLREDDAAVLFVEETGLPLSPAEYLVERKKLHAELFPTCKPLPGVMRLVQHLRAHKFPIAVATSSHADAFIVKSRNNGALFTLFDGHITTGDDALIRKGKPAPDLFQVAHKRLGFAPETAHAAVVFEDAVSGVQAGLNAGMNVVWVRDPRLPREEELEAKCFAVVESMEEFDPAWIGVAGFAQEVDVVQA
ncbi:HAD hydrolase, family IA [Allomyces macrogynus ATCC 38327]|uniref:HAD hydrolase, family IA n=1 Tax=Allomyces macrogynus (strain ATCC 38327) TaxID=578462 RepID=A0A0L0SXE4_ALLM3|nr:HAD hydrolase, family IA [Allomyces macrogynus ATCC 38327]|eukprot:KNE67065.1 HAD hydrolase, family IA [Allomyces macrogynus ATCC 38327]